MTCRLIALLLTLLCLINSAAFAADKPVHVVYMSPFQASAEFDRLTVAPMRKAASDFGFKFTVVNVVKNQVYNQKRIENIFALEPDYLILSYALHTDKVLQLAESFGVKTFMINSPIPEEDRAVIGYPRGKYPHWIGHIYPDDYRAGHQLVQLLHQYDNSANPQLLAFNGHRATSAAMERKRGLLDACRELGIEIKHIYAADWDPDITTKPLPYAVARYPEVKMFWAGSDGIALRIIEHMKLLNRHINKDYFTAGVDWSEQGLESIENGELTASLGGHFMIGAWAMVRIYDYQMGHDFADYGVEEMMPLAVADRNNVHALRRALREQPWLGWDFKHYTQTHSKNFDGYSSLLQPLEGVWAKPLTGTPGPAPTK